LKIILRIAVRKIFRETIAFVSQAVIFISRQNFVVEFIFQRRFIQADFFDKNFLTFTV